MFATPAQQPGCTLGLQVALFAPWPELELGSQRPKNTPVPGSQDTPRSSVAGEPGCMWRNEGARRHVPSPPSSPPVTSTFLFLPPLLLLSIRRGRAASPTPPLLRPLTSRSSSRSWTKQDNAMGMPCGGAVDLECSRPVRQGTVAHATDRRGWDCTAYR
jgi:hypothetical protein